VDQRRRQGGEGADRLIASPPLAGGGCLSFDPSWRGHERNRGDQAQEDLCEPRMSRRNRRRKKEEDREAAEDSLSHDDTQRGHTEPFHPSTALAQPQPQDEKYREKTDRAGDQAMAMFVENPADPL